MLLEIVNQTCCRYLSLPRLRVDLRSEDNSVTDYLSWSAFTM